jgi:two-component sensor histidine kinase
MANGMYDYHLLHPDVAAALETLRHDLTDAHERLRKDFAQKLNVPQEQLRAQARETDTALHTLQLSLHKRIDTLEAAHRSLVAHVEDTDTRLAALNELMDAP